MAEISVGDVVFFRDTNSLYGKAISWYNHLLNPSNPEKETSITHVGVVSKVRESDGETTVYVAEAKASTDLQTYSYTENELFDNENITVLSPNVDVDTATVKTLANRFEGRRYDYISIVALIFPFINFNNDARQLYCSEAVARILNKATPLQFKRPETVTPADLYNHPEINEAAFIKAACGGCGKLFDSVQGIKQHDCDGPGTQ